MDAPLWLIALRLAVAGIVIAVGAFHLDDILRYIFGRHHPEGPM